MKKILALVITIFMLLLVHTGAQADEIYLPHVASPIPVSIQPAPGQWSLSQPFLIQAYAWNITGVGVNYFFVAEPEYQPSESHRCENQTCGLLVYFSPTVFNGGEITVYKLDGTSQKIPFFGVYQFGGDQ